MSSSSESIDTCNTISDFLVLFKQHAKICTESDDSLISIYTNAAVRYLYRQYGLNITVREVSEDYCFNRYDNVFYLNNRIASDIVSVYNDVNDLNTEVTGYTFDAEKQTVTLPVNEDVCYEDVTITYNVGFECLPDYITESLLLLVTYYYDNRSQNSDITLSPIPDSIKDLMPYHFITSL